MLWLLFRPLWHVVVALTAERSPRRVALGVALGVLAGMVPKGNLTAWVLAVLLLGTRVNTGVGLLVALVVSGISPWLDPLTHRLGWRLLHVDGLAGLVGHAHELPLFPWLAWNNTVVLGSLVLGSVIFYPTYHLSHVGLQRIVVPRLGRK
jgi:uncharacterized protein (TIGR03546 family)